LVIVFSCRVDAETARLFVLVTIGVLLCCLVEYIGLDGYLLSVLEPLLDGTATISNTSRTQPNEGRPRTIAAVSEEGGFAKLKPVADFALGENLSAVKNPISG
jgi:hypothetical protein